MEQSAKNRGGVLREHNSDTPTELIDPISNDSNPRGGKPSCQDLCEITHLSNLPELESQAGEKSKGGGLDGPSEGDFAIPNPPMMTSSELKSIQRSTTHLEGAEDTETMGGVAQDSDLLDQVDGEELANLDELSYGEDDQLDNGAEQNLWMVGACPRKKTRKKPQLISSRQSSRLRGHGGTSVEEMARKRNQQQNLDLASTTFKNSFAILNEVEDDI
jgi:hypothetical protein